jgi:hypothetical protein
VYKPYFFKFANQATMRAILADPEVRWWGVVDETSDTFGFILHGHLGDLDEVGLIIHEQGTYDPDTGEEITPPTHKEGWHLNAVLKTPLPPSLTEYLVTPENPVRRFAGFE